MNFSLTFIRSTIPLLMATLLCNGAAVVADPATSPGPAVVNSTAVQKLSLQSSFRLAIDNSPRLAELRFKVQEQRGKVDEAYTPAYPTLNFSGNVTHTTPSVLGSQNVVIVPSDSYALGLTVNQALLTFGRLRWATAAAELTEKSTKEDYRREVENLFAEVATNYHDALLAQRAVSIAEERVQALQAQLRDSENLFKAGTVARFDVLRSQAELTTYQQQLLAARNNARLSIDRLLSALGQPLGQQVDLEVVPPPGPPPQNVDKATAQALELRPELAVLHWTLESAKARVSLENSQNKPRLDAYSTALDRTATGFSAGQTWSTGLIFSVPLYDGGLSAARIAQAQAVVGELTHSLENGQRSVRLEVRDAYNTMQNLWEKRDVSEQALAQAAEAFRVARIRYQNGVSTQVELLSAQAAYSEAEYAEALTWHDYQLAWARWRRVISAEYPAYVPGPLLRQRAPEKTGP